MYFELGAYKRVPKGLTSRGSGDICKIIIFCIFCLKLGGPLAPSPWALPSPLTVQ